MKALHIIKAMAPLGATHYLNPIGYYRKEGDRWQYWNANLCDWLPSEFEDGSLPHSIVLSNVFSFDEDRADAIGQNGNDGDHYSTPEEEEVMRECERRLEDGRLAQGMKHDSGKAMPGLISKDMPRAMMEISRVMAFGAQKYAPGNWQHVENAEQRYLDASWRHELQRSMGEPFDDETGLDHLAHKICCDLFRLELALRGRES